MAKAYRKCELEAAKVYVEIEFLMKFVTHDHSGRYNAR